MVRLAFFLLAWMLVLPRFGPVGVPSARTEAVDGAWSAQTDDGREGRKGRGAEKAGVNEGARLAPEPPARGPICSAVKQFPRPPGEKLSFEKGEVGALCRPTVGGQRGALDRCGDSGSDPYTTENPHASGFSRSRAAGRSDYTQSSQFTWASRKEMRQRGRVNLFADREGQSLYPQLLKRVEEIRQEMSEFCCGTDASCQKALKKVEVSVCKPKDNPNEPDPCVFGGYYQMPGESFGSMFATLYRLYPDSDFAAFRKLAMQNLTGEEIDRLNRLPTPVASASSLAGRNSAPFGAAAAVASLAKGRPASADAIVSQPRIEAGAGNVFIADVAAAALLDGYPLSGRIVLSSYVSASNGIQSLEPTIRHEFGHACAMVKMQVTAAQGRDPGARDKALRAFEWLDRIKDRCSRTAELPQAYYDFWEAMGESREFAGCLYKLTDLNRQQKIDRPCGQICPGHYLEEAVGVAFSMLNGDLDGSTPASFPNTCTHVRDGQHPMVSDIVECLSQHSPRFRDRVKRAYACG